MNQMEIFKNPEFGSVRVIDEDGKYLFCGTDVAAALGYANPRKAVRDHTRCGTKCSIGVQTGKKADGTPAVQMVEMLFIPEGDVYRLIVHSKLPSAERFERWVFDEVLPSIRQHGAYLTREKLWEVATSPEALLKLCSDLLAEREKNAALREDNAQLQGKAVYYDLFIDLRHSTNLRTTAKELDVPERRFVRFLLERRYVYRTPSGCVLPYTQLFNLLCEKADDVYGGRLPVHVRCLIDECANIGQIPKLEKLVATIRSREISACLVLQAQSQLKAIYKDNADTIIGNMDSSIFLGGKEPTTLKELAAVLGKETIDTYNTGESRGRETSHSLNYQKLGKELMSQDELAVMDGGKCILQLRGVRPFLSDKYDITQHPNYKYTADADPKNAFSIEDFLRARLKLKPNQVCDVYEIDAAADD